MAPAPYAGASHNKVSRKFLETSKCARSTPLLNKKPWAPDFEVLAPIREDALDIVEAAQDPMFRTVSQDLSILTGKPRSTSRAALDAVENDREGAYALLMSDLALTVVDSLPCDIAPLEAGEAAWLDSEEKVTCPGAYVDCSLLRVAHGRSEDLRLFALEPVQVICLLPQGEPLAPGWDGLDQDGLPEVCGLEPGLLAPQACKFDPGPVVVPLRHARLALVRVLKNPSLRPPGNSVAPPSQRPLRPAAGRRGEPALEGDADAAGEDAAASDLMASGLHRYRFLSEAGSGAFGTVHLAEADDCQRVAVKVVRPDAEGREERECQLLQRMRHPCIVPLIDSFRAPGVDGQTAVHIVMEYLPDTLHGRIDGKPLDPPAVAGFSRQLLRALAHLHGMGVAHRDVKPENILLSGATLKLGDFGSAKLLARDGAPSSSYICSRWWRAPELILGGTAYSTSIDWWSCGCVLAEMMSGSPLFTGQSSWGQMYEILRALGSPTAEELQAMAPGRGGRRMAAHLEKLAELRRPASRWEDLLPAFASEPLALQLPSRLLAYDPAARLPPAEALLSPFLARAEAAQAPLQFTEEELAPAAADVRRRLLQLASGRSAAELSSSTPPTSARRAAPGRGLGPASRRRRLPCRAASTTMGEDEGAAAPPPAVKKRRASAGADCEAALYSGPPAKCRRLSDVIHGLLAPAQARVFLPEQPPSPASTAPPSSPDGAEARPGSSEAVHPGEEIDDSL